MNSRLRPDFLWSITLGISFILWIVLPQFRLVLSLFLLLHLVVLVAGITRLATGFFCPAYCHASRESHCCALTFDDGPDPRLTPEILDLLEEFRYSATFFCIGRKVQEHPELAQKIISRGHEMACHDLQHTITSNFRRHRKMVRDITAANAVICKATGKYPLLYRPPVGLSNPHLRTALAQLGMQCIGWNRSLGDGGNRFPGKFSRMPYLAQPGSIILLHDCLPEPAHKDCFLKNLRALFAAMRQRDLSGVAVSTLLGISPYR